MMRDDALAEEEIVAINSPGMPFVTSFVTPSPTPTRCLLTTPRLSTISVRFIHGC